MRYPLLFALLFLLFSAPLFSQNPPVNCDTVLVVAKATAGSLTCDQPFANLTGALHPTAISYAWAGPNSFTSNKRVVAVDRVGTYVLTVTGPYGCTKQASAVVKDSCLAYPLQPPACPGADAYYPPSESCPEACVRPFIPTGYTYSTAGYQGDGTPPGGFCSMVQNDQWWAFVAGAQSGSITALSSNCANGDGIQMALYPECSASPVDCNGGMEGGGNTPITINPTGLTIGKVYYLMVDGYSGDLCEFEFVIPNNICNGGPHTSGPTSVSGLPKVCPKATFTYSHDASPGATAYLWTGPAGALINGQPSPVVIYVPGGKSVSVTFGTVSGFVSVRALYYFQPPSAPISLDVKVEPLPKTIFPNVTVCNEDLPYTLPWGDEVYNIGTKVYTGTLTSYLGCDSLVEQKVTAKPPIFINLGTITRCAGQCVSVGGVQYCASGTYQETLQSYQGCDSTVVFNLNILNPIAEILGGGTISCVTPVVVLNSAPSAGNSVKIWRNASGTVMGSGNTYMVTQPGQYTLTTTITSGGLSCTRQAAVVITGNTVPPTASAQGGALTCAAPSLTLQGSSSTPQTSFRWSGPGGFSSVLTSPSITQSGIYTLIVTNPMNGCTATATATVTADQTPPGVSALGGMLTCTLLQAQLTGSSPDPSATLLWTGPAGFSSTLPNPQVSEPGGYTLTATAANGCKSTANAVVTADQALPEVTVAPPAVLTCTTPNVMLQASSDLPLVAYAWVGPNGFSSNLPSPVVSVAGEYFLTATAANGCENMTMALVTADQQLPMVTVASPSVLTCNTPNGMLQASSDLPLVAYAWVGPNGFSSNLPSPIVSVAGEYILTATAANGCENMATAFVTADQQMPSVSVANAVLSCTTSSAVLSAQANPPLTAYAWAGPSGFTSNQSSTTVITEGKYTVTVTATNGCTATATATVTAPASYTAFLVEIAHPDCSNQATGTASASISGGLPPYNFLWSNGATTANISNLGVGIYSLIVTDQNGCATSTSVAITAVDNQPPTVTAQNATISLAANGIATVTLAAVNAQFADNCGPVIATITPASFDCSQKGSQIITVTATDQAGLTATATATVTVVDDIAPILTCPASLRVCPSGNAVQYNAPTASDNCSLAGGLLNQTQGLPSGATFPVGTTMQTYTFTDASGNMGACSFEVTVLPPIVFEKIEVTAPQSGQSNGAINLTVSGGTAPYSFAWLLSGQVVGTTEDLSSLPVGSYTVQVTDTEGCTYTSSPIEVKTATGSAEPALLAGISLRPNPTDGLAWAVFGSIPVSSLEISVLDATGRAMLRLVSEHQTAVFLDCTQLPAGIYWVRFSTDAESGVRKLVVSGR